MLQYQVYFAEFAVCYVAGKSFYRTLRTADNR